MSKFIFLENNYIKGDKFIEAYEIGIILKESQKKSEIEFIYSDTTVEVQKELIVSFDPKKTGDLYERKVCNVCHRLLFVKEFQKNQNGKNNRTVRRPSCNRCRKLIDGKKVPSEMRKKFTKIKPYLEKFICPVCEKKTIPGLTSKIVLDHNHESGEPRAWICDSCNTGLGRFKDNINILKKAIKYLETRKGYE